MNKFKKVIVTIFSSVLFIAILWTWIFGYTKLQSKEVEETPTQICNRLNSFYRTSWYDNKRQYDKDYETLQYLKQDVLDVLDYADTINYVKWAKVSDQLLNCIDATMKLNTERQAKVDKPEYLKIDTTKVAWYSAEKETPEPTTWKLDFMKLLK